MLDPFENKLMSTLDDALQICRIAVEQAHDVQQRDLAMSLSDRLEIQRAKLQSVDPQKLLSDDPDDANFVLEFESRSSRNPLSSFPSGRDQWKHVITDLQPIIDFEQHLELYLYRLRSSSEQCSSVPTKDLP